MESDRLVDSAAKRGFDVLVSTAGLLALSPAMLLTGWLVFVTSGRPVFYRSERVGRGGRRFRMAKFRTMVAGADRQGGSITTHADPRVTRLGRLLRATKLDELPQLFNVLVGDMSLVGPRPESPAWVAKYTDRQRRVLTVRPGITDPVQILFRHEEAFLRTDQRYLELLQHKVRGQLEYLDARTFWSDLLVIGKTIVALFQRVPTAEALQVYRSLGGPSDAHHGNCSSPTPCQRAT